MKRSKQHKYELHGISVQDIHAMANRFEGLTLNVGSLTLAAKPESVATGEILKKQGNER